MSNIVDDIKVRWKYDDDGSEMRSYILAKNIFKHYHYDYYRVFKLKYFIKHFKI